MQTRQESERVEFFISVGQQPGVGAWFTVWRVAFSRRARIPKAAAVKRMSRETCAA